MGVEGKIISYLGCDYEVIRNAENASVVMKKYMDLLAQGKKEGFTPLIIVPSDMMLEVIEYASSDYENRGHISAINKNSESINAKDFLSKRIDEAMSVASDSGYDFMGEFTEYEPSNSFNSLMDYVVRRPYETIVAAKIPTDKPWELAAWLPMGGWNECPTPDEQVAVFKYWYEKYGAIPAVVHGDIWELYIERPPTAKDEAAALALEQFGFCGDIVWQGVEKVNVLAATLVNSKVWYFWWD